jgi:hypothetical protein
VRRTSGYRLQASGYRLQATGYRLQATGYSLLAKTFFSEQDYAIITVFTRGAPLQGGAEKTLGT